MLGQDNQECFQDRIEKQFPKICSNIYCGAYAPAEWEPIILEALEELNDYPIQIAQIKEKFGGLRIYFDVLDQSDDEVWDKCYAIIDRAEQAVYNLEKKELLTKLEKLCDEMGSI